MDAGRSFKQSWAMFIIEWDDKERRYLTSSRARSNGERTILTKYTDLHSVREFEAAGIIRTDDIQEIIDVYIKAREEYPNASIEVVNVDIDVVFSPIDIGDGEYLELRRKRAIEKLTQDDIEVLNLGRFVIYDKLKNHNVDGLLDD